MKGSRERGEPLADGCSWGALSLAAPSREALAEGSQGPLLGGPVRRVDNAIPTLGHGNWEKSDQGTGTVPCP